jgi:hypothetical protein
MGYLFFVEKGGKPKPGEFAKMLLSVQGETSLVDNWPLSQMHRLVAGRRGLPSPGEGDLAPG